MKIFIPQALLLIVVVLVAGCGGSSGDSPNPATIPPVTQSPPGTDTSAIAGFWDVTEENDDGEQDILYALIGTGGVVTEYDFDQDAAGDGRNCFYISTSTLTALGDNQFQQSDEIEGGFDTFTATKQGALLTVSFIDSDDDNENGSTVDVITVSYNELSGIDPATLISCDQAPAMATIPVVNGNGLIIGGFDGTRGGDNSIDIGAYRTSLETYITGVSVVTTSTLSAEFLDQIDIFVVDAVWNSGTAVSRLNLVETAALESFVNSGGGLIVASDNPSFQGTSNSFLTPFGLNAGGIASGGPHTAAVIDRSTHSEITDGPFGQVNTVSANNTGSFTVLGGFAVLANWNSGPLTDSPAVVARSDIGEGLGRIVAVADHQTIIAGLLDSEILFLNSVYFVSKGFTVNVDTIDGTLDDSPNSVVNMYGVISPDSDANPDTFVKVDVGSAQQTVVSSYESAFVGRNLDWNPIAGRFFGTDNVDSPGSVHEIDPATGTSAQIAFVRDSNGVQLDIGALSFASGGTLYAAEGRNVRNGLRIGIVDLQNETFTAIMTIPQGVFVPGIDIGPDGTLYAIYSRFQTSGDTDNSVVAINLQARQVMSEVSLEVDFAIGDVDFAADGFLYHSNYSYALIQINPETGDQRNVGFGEVGALAGLASIVPPDQATALGLLH